MQVLTIVIDLRLIINTLIEVYETMCVIGNLHDEHPAKSCHSNTLQLDVSTGFELFQDNLCVFSNLMWCVGVSHMCDTVMTVVNGRIDMARRIVQPAPLFHSRELLLIVGTGFDRL